MVLDAKAVLAETTLFGQLSDRSLEQLAAAALQLPFSKHRVIHLQGEPDQRLYVLASGAVKLMVGSLNGLRWAPGVLIPPAAFGMHGLSEGVYAPAGPRRTGPERCPDRRAMGDDLAAGKRALERLYGRQAGAG
jgi:CRP-like cAMP-binding protein